MQMSVFHVCNISRHVNVRARESGERLSGRYGYADTLRAAKKYKNVADIWGMLTVGGLLCASDGSNDE